MTKIHASVSLGWLVGVCTVPTIKGDPKYSERGPKGDLILSKKGTLSNG